MIILTEGIMRGASNVDVSPTASHPRRLLCREDLRRRGIRFSNTHLLKMEREGKFVARLYLSPAKVAWPEDEVDVWLEARLAERKVAASS